MSEDKPPYGVRSTPSFAGPPPTVLSLKLPLAPSKNRLHIPAHRTATRKDGTTYRYQGQRNSPEYEAFIETVGWEVRAQTTPEERDVLQGKRLAIHILVRFPEGSKREEDGDAANVVDSVLDAVAQGLGVNDKQFWAGMWTRHEYADLPECLVRIWQAHEAAQVEDRGVAR